MNEQPVPLPRSRGESRLRRLWHQVRFRDAFLVSLVPLVAIVLLFGASLNDYLRARDFDD